ncbi:hypothetical protein [Hwangdonia seohaensis]|uniref:Lipoprotein n=2 Tax=Hwangdonia TaxID=1649460 RepID=A0ABW3R9U2_9FLAO|nr:hypothetical protein [Hwangdonia seohaensis]
MKKLLFVLSLTLSLSCCNKDDNPRNPIDQLPPATQTGENTFGCLVNGEPLVITNSREQVAIYQQGQLQFGGGGITMILGDPIKINEEYDLTGKARFFVDPNPQLGCHYDFQDSYQGNLIFSKIDRVNYFISGTFSFSTITNNCEDIKITEGRFDMKYIP